MEGVVERHFKEDLNTIRHLVRQLFTEFRPDTQLCVLNSYTGGMDAMNQDSDGPKPSLDDHNNSKERNRGQPSVDSVLMVLRRFMEHILHHPAVLSSPASLQTKLAFELQTFLLAHITLAQDNHRLRAQCNPKGDNSMLANANSITVANKSSPMSYREPGRTFYHWVRSTSADHTSCPFSFIFYNCLVHASLPKSSQMRGGAFGSARMAYLAEDACRHLASLCRIYNDLGSLTR